MSPFTQALTSNRTLINSLRKDLDVALKAMEDGATQTAFDLGLAQSKAIVKDLATAINRMSLYSPDRAATAAKGEEKKMAKAEKAKTEKTPKGKGDPKAGLKDADGGGVEDDSEAPL